jgi:hypothetical protein
MVIIGTEQSGSAKKVVFASKKVVFASCNTGKSFCDTWILQWIIIELHVEYQYHPKYCIARYCVLNGNISVLVDLHVQRYLHRHVPLALPEPTKKFDFPHGLKAANQSTAAPLSLIFLSKLPMGIQGNHYEGSHPSFWSSPGISPERNRLLR